MHDSSTDDAGVPVRKSKIRVKLTYALVNKVPTELLPFESWLRFLMVCVHLAQLFLLTL